MSVLILYYETLTIRKINKFRIHRFHRFQGLRLIKNINARDD